MINSGPSAFERHFVFLLAILLFVGLVTSSDEVLQLFHGESLTTVKVTSGLRLAREGVYAVLLIDFGLYLIVMRGVAVISRGALLFSSAVVLWSSVCAYYSVMLHIPLPVIFAGLRFLEYLPLALIVGRIWLDAGDRPFRQLSKAVLVFMVIESVLGALETRLPTPFWGRTFIGSRAFGTFTTPNIFGPAMVLCYLFVQASLSKRLQLYSLPVVLFDALASGSRAAVIGLALIFATDWLLRIRGPAIRLLISIVGLLSGPLVLRLVSSSAITGRATDVGSGGLERLGVWSRTIQKLDTALDLWLGWGTGLGSNTVFSIYGYDMPGAYISDNTFFFLVGSFGVVGVLFFASALAFTAWRLRADPIGLPAVVVFTLLLLISQALEVYPINVLAICLIAWRLARTPGGAASLVLEKSYLPNAASTVI